MTTEVQNFDRTTSSGLAKPTAASLNRQKQPVINVPTSTTTNPNIMKKSLAKMTAAFKPKPLVATDSGVDALK